MTFKEYLKENCSEHDEACKCEKCDCPHHKEEK